MVYIEGVVFCDGCGVEVAWSPVVVKTLLPGSNLLSQRPLRYCCQTCADGLPCVCAERMELEDDRRSSSTAQGLDG
jgi:hypothetical protein